MDIIQNDGVVKKLWTMASLGLKGCLLKCEGLQKA